MVVVDGVAEGLSLSRTFRGAHSPVLSLAYLPSQKQCVSGSQDGSIMVSGMAIEFFDFRASLFVQNMGLVGHGETKN